ncbi:MAG: hypothetical protein ACP5NZ_02365 [Nanobdellota archaeon]
MKNNKKGLSTIVATLLVILLTLVAVGIIWIVIRNVVQGGADDVGLSSKCLATEVVATKVSNVGDVYAVTLQKKRGEYQIGGVRLFFSDASDSGNYPVPVPYNPTNFSLDLLSTITVSNIDLASSGLTDPNKVQVLVYFINENSGEEQACDTTTSFEFVSS